PRSAGAAAEHAAMTTQSRGTTPSLRHPRTSIGTSVLVRRRSRSRRLVLAASKRGAASERGRVAQIPRLFREPEAPIEHWSHLVPGWIAQSPTPRLRERYF